MNILIICTGNTCRSPMAEGIFKTLIQRYNLSIKVKSAGIYALDGDLVSTNAVKALENIFDISNHNATLLHQELIDEADVILTMTMGHKRSIISKFPNSKDKVFLIYEYANEKERDVMDPFGSGIVEYEKVRDELYLLVEEIINKLESTIDD